MSIEHVTVKVLSPSYRFGLELICNACVMHVFFTVTSYVQMTSNVPFSSEASPVSSDARKVRCWLGFFQCHT